MLVCLHVLGKPTSAGTSSACNPPQSKEEAPYYVTEAPYYDSGAAQAAGLQNLQHALRKRARLHLLVRR